jgi:carbamoyl-phosphate synthase large subunit
VSVANRDKRAMVFPVKRLADLGFEVLATAGTADVLRRNGVRATVLAKHTQDPSRSVVAEVLEGRVDLIINTPTGSGARVDGYEIRGAAVTKGVPCITTIQGAAAAVQGIEALLRGEVGVRSLQEHHRDLQRRRAAADGAADGAVDGGGD